METADDVRRREAARQRLLTPADLGEIRVSRPQPVRVRDGHPVGRNAPCPCGSGRKFKKCHRPAVA